MSESKKSVLLENSLKIGIESIDKHPDQRKRDEVDDALKLLRKIKTFARLRTPALLKVLGLATVHRMKSKSILVSTKHYPCEHMYVLLEGISLDDAGQCTAFTMVRSKYQVRDFEFAGLKLISSPLIRNRTKIEE